MQKQYAWFSSKMCRLGGYVKYRLLNGEEIIATVISNSPSDSGAKWNDLIFLGEIMPNSLIESHISKERLHQARFAPIRSR